MPLNKVAICNLALSRLAIGKRISSLDDTRPEAALLKEIYDFCRETVLQDRVWPFAVRHVVPALVEFYPTPEWSYSYRVPAECIRLDRLVENVIGSAGDLRWVTDSYVDLPPNIPYTESSDDSGRLVMTNEEDPLLLYTHNISDEQLFTPMFSSALAWKIAAEVATALVVDADGINRAMQMYELEISRAHSRELQSLNDTPPADSSFITAGY
jgi:hypothetical protein